MMLSYVALFGIVLLLAGLIGWLVRDDNRRAAQRAEKRKVWEVIAEGRYGRVEYGDEEHWERRRSGAMVHHTSNVRRLLKLTIITFEDGRSFILKGQHDIPFKWGTKIEIHQNGLGERKLVVAAPASTAA